MFMMNATRHLDDEERIRRKSFLLMVPIFGVTATFWGFAYYLLDLKRSAAIPITYGVVSLLSYGLFAWNKNFNFFRATQLFIILFVSGLLHLSLGGFVSSGGVLLFTVISPLGALAFHNARAALRFFIGFIFLVVFVPLLEGYVFAKPEYPPEYLMRISFALNIAMVSTLVFVLMRYFVIETQNAKTELAQQHSELAVERDKSEKLLLNILPAAVATRLKDGTRVIADEFSTSGILFSDIVGFTSTSRALEPGILVENLNKIFSHIDGLATKHGLEKIKTIGDAYMVASGIPKAKENHLRSLAMFALELQRDIGSFSLNGKDPCQIRIGMHTGPVMAGVLGTNKFAYDIWGDAVNTASRM